MTERVQKVVDEPDVVWDHAAKVLHMVAADFLVFDAGDVGEDADFGCPFRVL